MMFDDIRNDVHAPSTRFRVKGESMVPTLLSGDVVIVTPVVVDDLIPGDYVFIAAGKVSYIHLFAVVLTQPGGMINVFIRVNRRKYRGTAS